MSKIPTEPEMILSTTIMAQDRMTGSIPTMIEIMPTLTTGLTTEGEILLNTARKGPSRTSELKGSIILLLLHVPSHNRASMTKCPLDPALVALDTHFMVKDQQALQEIAGTTGL